MTRIEFNDGYCNELYLRLEGDYYKFRNDVYGMILNIHKDEIRDYLKEPTKSSWGSYSSSNTVREDDRYFIIRYLQNKILGRYKTVTEVMNSRSKKKKEYLNKFSLGELLEYRKEKANEVESRG